MRPDKKKNRGRGRGHPAQAQTSAQKEVKFVGQPSNVSKQEQPQEEKKKNEGDESYDNQVNQANNEEQESSTENEDEEQAPRKSYSRREIFTNWEQWQRYDELSMEQGRVGNEEEGDTGMDFEKLLKAPTSADGHFHFKSEKLEAPPTGNLFALDLKALSDGLKTIPFYKQLDLPISYFSESAIKAMDQEAINATEVPITKVGDKPSQPVKNLDKQLKTISKLKDNNINVEETLTSAVKNIKITTSATSPLPSPSIESQSLISVSTTTSIEANNQNSPVSCLKETIISEPQRSQNPEPISPPSTHVVNKVERIPSPITTDQFLDSINVEPETSAIEPAQPSNVKSQDNNDLEAWLDSVLDD